VAKQQVQAQGAIKKVKKPRKKVSRTVPLGIITVKASFNNTIVSVTDLAGNVLTWASAGTCNFLDRENPLHLLRLLRLKKQLKKQCQFMD
jgi:hypothetical protein